MKSVLITIILLSIPLCTCVELHACYGIDCGSGLCFERGSTGYVCICHDGYEGDRCQRHRRLTRGTSSFSCDDATPCQNGGTCIETSLDDDKDDYDGEAPVDMDGEAPLDGDDMMLDCSVEGNCYICLCGPEFTGVNCSEPTECSVAVRNCARCRADDNSKCEECSEGYEMTNNACSLATSESGKGSRVATGGCIVAAGSLFALLWEM